MVNLHSSLHNIISLPYLAELFLTISTLLILVIGSFLGDKKTVKITWSVIFSLVLAIIIFILKEQYIASPDEVFVTSDFLVFSKILILLSTIFCLLLYLSHINFSHELARFEFPIIILFTVIGMMVLISANDLLIFYLGLELQSLSIYILTAFGRDKIKNSEAGLKYFILGAISSACILFAISIIYGVSGSISFHSIASIFTNSFSLSQADFLLVFAVILLIAGLLFKLAAFPFHVWAPDVYEGSSTPVTVFISTVPKISAFIILFRILNIPFNDFHAVWGEIIYYSALFSMLVGSIAALFQQNIKRLLAYASISHVGFMLLPLLFQSGDTNINALINYLVIYIVSTIGAFAAIIYLKQSYRKSEIDSAESVENIELFSGLGQTKPFFALSLMMLLLSMSGLPPFAGFFAKFFVLKTAIKNGFIFISLIGAVATVISAFYYLKIIKIMYFCEPKEEYIRPVNHITRFILFLSVVFNIFYFISPFTFLSIVPAL